MADSRKEIPPEMHSAGATIPHESPFSALDHGLPGAAISSDVRERWVVPYYRHLPDDIGAVEGPLLAAIGEVTPSLVKTLLADANWRPRIAAATFVAIRRLFEFEDVVGRLLLRSDLAYAGHGYCVALARLNTPRAVDYLREYLGYYLKRGDLWFDQASAMAALGWLDRENGTDHAASLDATWAAFVANKPGWDLSRTATRFETAMTSIGAFAVRASLVAG